jgi:hypothetical protein
MEWKNYAIIIFAVLMGCTADNQNVTALAIRLANEGGAELPADYRQGYIPCGVKSLSGISDEKIDAALKAPDISTIWATLGSDALDAYVSACREVDRQRGPPPITN